MSLIIYVVFNYSFYGKVDAVSVYKRRLILADL